LKKKTDLAIVNRAFWPDGQVLSRALLALAESCSAANKVCVITQSVNGRLANTLSTAEKGAKLRILDVRSRSNSSTGLVLRSIDVLLFMCWVFIGLVISRPKKVYVSTNPPVVVPFVVFLYSKTFKAEYYYHL